MKKLILFKASNSIDNGTATKAAADVFYRFGKFLQYQYPFDLLF